MFLSKITKNFLTLGPTKLCSMAGSQFVPSILNSKCLGFSNESNTFYNVWAFSFTGNLMEILNNQALPVSATGGAPSIMSTMFECTREAGKYKLIPSSNKEFLVFILHPCLLSLIPNNRPKPSDATGSDGQINPNYIESGTTAIQTSQPNGGLMLNKFTEEKIQYDNHQKAIIKTRSSHEINEYICRKDLRLSLPIFDGNFVISTILGTTNGTDAPKYKILWKDGEYFSSDDDVYEYLSTEDISRRKIIQE